MASRTALAIGSIFFLLFLISVEIFAGMADYSGKVFGSSLWNLLYFPLLPFFIGNLITLNGIMKEE